MSEKPKLEAVKILYESNARQIPEMLRKLADDVSKPPPDVTVDQAFCIIRDSKTGRINFYGWGDITIDSSLSMLAQATTRLSDIADRGILWSVAHTATGPEEKK